MFLNEYPYTDFHEMNLDWILKRILDLSETVRNFVAVEKITYAVPLQWDITKQYAKNTVVTDNGSAYLSTQPVPTGVQLNNTEYWMLISDVPSVVTSIKEQISAIDDGSSSVASFNIPDRTLFWLNNNLFIAKGDIQAGDAYVSTGANANIEAQTVADYVERLDIISTPEMYDAAGDGVTDDTAAINKALANGGMIIFKKGATYLVDPDASLLVQDNSTIDMNGATVQAMATSSGTYEIFNISNKKNVTIKNGTVIGDKTTHTGTTGEWGMGVYVGGSSNVTIDNIDISDCWGDGVYIGDTPEYDLHKCKNVTVTNCIIHGCRRQGISAVWGDDIIIHGNKIYNIAGTAPEACIDIEPNNSQEINRILVSNNLIIATKKGITVYGGPSNFHIYGVQISNNIFQGTGSSSNLMGATTHGLDISGNTFTGDCGTIISIGSNYGKFSGNKIYNITGLYMLYLNSCEGWQITDNSFLDVTTSGSGIYFNKSSRNTFSNNTIRDCNTTSSDDYAMYFVGSGSDLATYNLITDNILQGITYKYAIAVGQNGERNTFTGNTIDGTYDYVAYRRQVTGSYNNLYFNNIKSGTSGVDYGTGGSFAGSLINNIIDGALV